MVARIPYSDVAVAESYQNNNQSMRAVARDLNISRGAVKAALERARRNLGIDIDKPISGGVVAPKPTRIMPLPKKGEVARYIITAAQNNTDCHVEFFENLVAYAEWVGAQVMVGSFSYNRASYSQKATKRDLGPTEDDRKEDWYDPIFEPYWMDEAVELAPMLTWRGELNIQPTAKRPLSDLQTYGGRQSTIFPHTKFAMESVAGTKADGAKLTYTTGTATMMNYIKKKAGLQAEFHHSYGAVIVEVDHDGNWFVRQLNADRDGTFYDIPDKGQVGAIKVARGEVYADGEDVEAVNWGDTHVRVIDQEQKELAFGAGGILDSLRPKHQIHHDVLDFAVKQSHHDRHNPHARARKHAKGWTRIDEEVLEVKKFLDEVRRPWCTTIVVEANHDRHLDRWLAESDFRHDDSNAIFYLECELAFRKAIAEDPDRDWSHLHEALKRMGLPADDLFLGVDDGFILCAEDGSDGIECSLHGDIGPNGSRGSPLGLSKMGRRANSGHTHSACVIDGLYVAGTLAQLSQEWNRGPSSWSHSHIVTYPNGKRTIITCYNGKWRA
ncbi:MAG TPA: hypothetical protein VIG24_06435 [Acidimicrobiia bacterium]